MVTRWRCLVVAAIGVTAGGLPLFGSGVEASAAGPDQDDLSVRNYAQRLAVTADDAKLDQWQKEVDEGIAKYREELKSGYPAKPTRESLHPKSRFSLAEAPGDVFRFTKQPSPRIYDFESVGNEHIKRMVEADVFLREVKVLEDPLRDAKAIVEKVEQMVEVLKALGPRLREEVDAIEAKSTHTLELLKRGLSAEKLKSLAQFEAQAKAELEAAKKMAESIQLADGAVVKSTTEAGRLLRLASQMVEGMGPEAAGVRKAMRNMELQLSHLVASSGAEMESSVRHIKRAGEQLAALTKSFQEGMEELKQRRTLLQLVEEAEKTLQLTEDELRTIVGLGLASGQIRKDAQAAEAAHDSLTLQQLLQRAGDMSLRVEEAVEAAKALLADLSLRVQAVDSMVASVQSESLKARGVSAAEGLRTRGEHLQKKLKHKATQASDAIAAVKEEVSRQLGRTLSQYSTAISEGDAWVRQAAQQHRMLNAALLARTEEAAAARKAADQFNKMLMEDIEEAQNKVTSGQAQWSDLEKHYKFDSRRAAAERYMDDARSAALRAAAALRSAERQAEDFYGEAGQTIEDLKKLEKKVQEVAEAFRRQQDGLVKEHQRLEAAGAAAAAAAAAAEAAAAQKRAESASKIASRFASQRQDVHQQVEETKAALAEIGKKLQQQQQQPQAKPAKEGTSVEEGLSSKEVINRYGRKASEHLTHGEQHLERAKELKAQMQKVQGTLSADVKELKAALKRNSIQDRLKESSSSSKQGGGPVQRPSSGGLSETLQRRVVHLVALGGELKKQEEACMKAQREAQKAAANVRLASLRAVVGDGPLGISDMGAQELQTVLQDADAAAEDVAKKGHQLEKELQKFRDQEGGDGALEQMLEDVLKQLRQLLSHADSRLENIMKLGVPAFEALVLQTQQAAENLHAARQKQTAEGEGPDADSAAAAAAAAADAFAAVEGRARQLGEFLRGEAEDVEVCASRVSSSLDELKAFSESNKIVTPGSSSSSEAPDSQTTHASAGGTSRRLSVAADKSSSPSSKAAPAVVSLSDLQQTSADLKTRAGDAKAGLDSRLQHLESLRNLGNEAPPAVAAASYGAAAKQYLTPESTEDTASSSIAAEAGAAAGKGDSSGTSGEGDGLDEPQEEERQEEEQGAGKEEEREEGTSSPNLYLAVGIASGVLLLLGLSSCGFYARRQRGRRLKSLKQGASTSTANQQDPAGGGDLAGEAGAFSSPTRDFDEATHAGGAAADQEDISSTAGHVEGHEETMPGAVGGGAVAGGGAAVFGAVAAQEIMGGDLEMGAIETSRRRYLVDDHHLVARELSHSQPPRCRTPLVFFNSSTVAGPQVQGAIAAPSVQTARMWESRQREGSYRGRSASPTMGHHKQQYVQQQLQQQQLLQEQEQQQSKRARELENLEAAVKLEQESEDSQASSSTLHQI